MAQSPTPVRDDVVGILLDLVGIESVNPNFPGGQRGEVAVAQYVADYCAALGLPTQRQEVLPGRTNVLATLKVPGAARTLLLDSHMDTVSVDAMGPSGLRPEVRDGRITGRGSCDDKGPLAAMMAALASLTRNPAGLRCNVALLATVDEEYLMRGAAHFSRSGVSADGAVVGEPTRLEIVIAHKGFVRWTLHTIGRAAHSSHPDQGDNAIYQMAELIQALREAVEPRLQARSHPLVGSATWSIGKIQGGAAVNIVPERCTIEIDRRLLPNENGNEALAEFDEILDRIRREHPRIRLESEPPFGAVGGLDTPRDAPLVRAMEEACRDVLGGFQVTGVPYGTNASKFIEANIPSVVFGPGDIRQAHTADEYVEIDQLRAAARIYEATARHF